MFTKGTAPPFVPAGLPSVETVGVRVVPVPVAVGSIQTQEFVETNDAQPMGSHSSGGGAVTQAHVDILSKSLVANANFMPHHSLVYLLEYTGHAFGAKLAGFPT